MDVHVQGTLPNLVDGAEVSYQDADIEYNTNNKAGSILSRGRLIATVNNVEQTIEIDQQVRTSSVQVSTEK